MKFLSWTWDKIVEFVMFLLKFVSDLLPFFRKKRDDFENE